MVTVEELENMSHSDFLTLAQAVRREGRRRINILLDRVLAQLREN